MATNSASWANRRPAGRRTPPDRGQAQHRKDHSSTAARSRFSRPPLA